MRLGTAHCSGQIEMRAMVNMSGPQSDETVNGLDTGIAALFKNNPRIQLAAVTYASTGGEQTFESSVIYNRLSDDPNFIPLKDQKKSYLTEKEIRAWFITAGFVDPEKILLLKNGYDPADEESWFFVKTRYGFIEIGWRKRVLSINWSETPARVIVTTDDVTKGTDMVHAWSVPKAIEYLTALRVELERPTGAEQ